MSDSFEQLGVPIFWALWYKSESPKYRARYNSPSSAIQNKFKCSVLKIMCVDYDSYATLLSTATQFCDECSTAVHRPIQMWLTVFLYDHITQKIGSKRYDTVQLMSSLTLLLFLPAVISKVWNVVILHTLLNILKMLSSIFFWKVVTHIVRHIQISCLPPVRVPWRSETYQTLLFFLKRDTVRSKSQKPHWKSEIFFSI